MKIKVITDRMPWIDNAPRHDGDVVDADGDVAKALIDAGFAVAVDTPRGKVKREAAE